MLSNTTGVHDSLHLCSYFIHYCKSNKFKTKHDSLITLFLAREPKPIKRNIIGRDIMDHFHLAALSIPFYPTGVNVLNDPHPIYPGHLDLRFK